MERCNLELEGPTHNKRGQATLGPAVAAYRASGGTTPTRGYATFDYYGNAHWAPFGRSGTACGPAAITTLARWKRGRNLGERELERARNNLGPAGTDIAGITKLLSDFSIPYLSEWISGDQACANAIRDRVTRGLPVVVLVDWGSQTPFENSSWGAHYMVVYGATNDRLFFTNNTRVVNGVSQHFSYTDAQFIDLVKGQILTIAGFYSIGHGAYRLLYATR